MNKCRDSKLPPLFINNQFILDCKEKAKYFNEFFSQQCKPIVNNSVLPNLTLLTDQKIENISIENCDTISVIRNINPNKASGSDGISRQMLLICDETVVLPLQKHNRNFKVSRCLETCKCDSYLQKSADDRS